MPGASNPPDLVAVGAMDSRCCHLTVLTVMKSLQDKGHPITVVGGSLGISVEDWHGLFCARTSIYPFSFFILEGYRTNIFAICQLYFCPFSQVD